MTTLTGASTTVPAYRQPRHQGAPVRGFDYTCTCAAPALFNSALAVPRCARCGGFPAPTGRRMHGRRAR